MCFFRALGLYLGHSGFKLIVINDPRKATLVTTVAAELIYLEAVDVGELRRGGSGPANAPLENDI